MKKAILVNEENRAAVVAALAVARCAAVSYEDVASIGRRQDTALLLLMHTNAKICVVGAVATHVVNKAKITLRLKAAGWYLIDAKASRAANSEQLTLTEAQDATVCAVLHCSYRVATKAKAQAKHSMKPIAIKAGNRAAIAHTVTTYAQLDNIAARYERTVEHLVGAKRAAGAKAVHVSGGVLSNSYTNSRWVTKLTLNRDAAGWTLVDVARQTGFGDAGAQRLTLTAAQDVAAIATQRRKYKVVPSAAEAKAKALKAAVAVAA